MPEFKDLAGLELRERALRDAKWTIKKADLGFNGAHNVHILIQPNGERYDPTAFEHLHVWMLWQYAPAIENDIQLALKHLPISPLVTVRIEYRTEVSSIEIVQSTIKTKSGSLMSVPDFPIHARLGVETKDLATEYCRAWLYYKEYEPNVESAWVD
jgi:hypothetical protein